MCSESGRPVWRARFLTFYPMGIYSRFINCPKTIRRTKFEVNDYLKLAKE